MNNNPNLFPSRKNNFEMEDQLRRRNIKKKFGVKILNINANRMKKVLDEDLPNAEEEIDNDLAIIEYPELPPIEESFLKPSTKVNESLTNRCSSPLTQMTAKIISNTQIRKCDQFEQLNLTLSDNDSDIINNDDSDCIDQIHSLNLGSQHIITNTKPSVNIIQTQNVYQKKKIGNTSLKKNENEDDHTVVEGRNDLSLSLFSNISGNKNQDKEKERDREMERLQQIEREYNNFNMNKKLLAQFKEESPQKDGGKERKTLGDKGMNTKSKSKSKENSLVNDMKLLENYQRLKQLEQLQQLKDLEKMKDLMDLNNNVNRLNNHNLTTKVNYPLQQIDQIPMTIPYQNSNPNIHNNIIPTAPSAIPSNPYININTPQFNNGYSQLDYIPIPSHISLLKKHNSNPTINLIEPQSCKYCEEIYQYTIMNNLPLKMIKCLYCNRVMNSKTLEFYITKYKKDLESKYRHDINQTTEEINEEDDGTEQEQEKEEEQSYEEEKQKYEAKPKTKPQQEQTPKREQKKVQENHTAKPPRNFRHINHNNNTTDQVENANSTPEALIEIPIRNKTSTHLHSSFGPENNEDSANEILDRSDNISLAEAFRSKRAKILTKIEKRANSVKDHTETKNEPLEMKMIRERQNQKSKTITNDINIKPLELSLPQSSKPLNMSQTSRSKADPSPDLMNRLIKGEKAKMSNKEMKALNNRLYSKLVDVRAKDEENDKKDELSRLNQMKRNYTNNLKDKVVKSFNLKKTH